MPGLDVLGVDNIMLAVGDLAEARAFYESTLGLVVKFAVPQAGIVGYRLGSEEPGLMIRLQAMPHPRRGTRPGSGSRSATQGRPPRPFGSAAPASSASRWRS